MQLCIELYYFGPFLDIGQIMSMQGLKTKKYLNRTSGKLLSVQSQATPVKPAPQHAGCSWVLAARGYTPRLQKGIFLYLTVPGCGLGRGHCVECVDSLASTFQSLPVGTFVMLECLQPQEPVNDSLA